MWFFFISWTLTQFHEAVAMIEATKLKIPYPIEVLSMQIQLFDVH